MKRSSIYSDSMKGSSFLPPSFLAKLGDLGTIMFLAHALKKVFINSNLSERRDGSVWLRRKQAELPQRK